MNTISVYFDVISPYSYLGLELIARHELSSTHQIELIPVALGSILQRTGNPGPAQIPVKRVESLRDVCMQCQRFGVAIRGPHGHPFNTLPALRFISCIDDLALRLRTTLTINRAIWRDSRPATTEIQLQEILAEAGELHPGWQDIDAFIKAANGRKRLKDQTEAALAANVFGVPTFRVNGLNFWGSDRIDLLADYIARPDFYTFDNYQRMLHLPSGM